MAGEKMETKLRGKIMEAVRAVKETNPMAGSVTNTVTMNFVANAQLAVGGSAAMVFLSGRGRIPGVRRERGLLQCRDAASHFEGDAAPHCKGSV